MNARTDNENLRHGWLAAAFVLLLAVLLQPATAAAADAVGRVLSVRGDVTAVRDGEPRRTLSRGDDVFEGDEITTGPNGRTQVRFIDEGLTNLSPSTTFAVDEYRLEDTEEDGGGSIVMSFLRGAMRTVTGLIGAREQDTYRMNTPTATIGVRGTGYALQYCDAACAQEFGGEPGLYGRVDDGTIQVDTPQGSLQFSAGAYFFVPEGGAPQGILQPPEGILDGEEDEGNGDGGDTGDDVAIIPVEDDEGDDPLLTEDGGDETDFEAGDEFDAVTGLFTTGVAAATDDGSSASAQLFGDENNIVRNNDDQIVEANFTEGSSWVVDTGIATLAESGTHSELAVTWGRWTGTDAFFVDGQTASGNLAFTVTDNITEPDTLGGLSGNLDYVFAEGPSAFDSFGGLWTVDSLSLNIDFDATAVDLNRFALAQGGQTLLILDSNHVTNQNLDLVNNGIVVDASDSQVGDSASITGRFVGTDAGGIIVTFTAVDNFESTIVGTSVLEQGDFIQPR